VEADSPEDFGLALEDDDSIEMFRIDIEQRVFGIDQEVTDARVVSATSRNFRPTISPPLLV
jgi:hypothetical protein